ncbi:transmembrane protein 91-like [Corticium candelabrum]|uniref:transmembrane protein 91-like n=1 Tax=Corticium candelabrum TaxID=121492 RepID=UPI002E25DB2A|nr:transmembrane protein 91-like [Corticium candelabrum]XP_062518258.1 transmembrane protein 91-like [Corticium candelabrum]
MDLRRPLVTGGPDGTITSEPRHVTTFEDSALSDDKTFILSVLTCIFCFWPVGIAGIIYSVKAHKRYDRGDANGGDAAAQTSRALSIAAFVVGTILYFAGIIGVIGGFA